MASFAATRISHNVASPMLRRVHQPFTAAIKGLSIGTSTPGMLRNRSCDMSLRAAPVENDVPFPVMVSYRVKL